MLRYRDQTYVVINLKQNVMLLYESLLVTIKQSFSKYQKRERERESNISITLNLKSHQITKEENKICSLCLNKWCWETGELHVKGWN